MDHFINPRQPGRPEPSRVVHNSDEMGAFDAGLRATAGHFWQPDIRGRRFEMRIGPRANCRCARVAHDAAIACRRSGAETWRARRCAQTGSSFEPTR